MHARAIKPCTTCRCHAPSVPENTYLQYRLLDVPEKNNRGWNWRHGSQPQCNTYLASGEHRHHGVHTKGPRNGQKCVKKVFKTGGVYEFPFFQNDLSNNIEGSFFSVLLEGM